MLKVCSLSLYLSSVDQEGLQFTDIHLPQPFQGWELKVGATTPSWESFYLEIGSRGSLDCLQTLCDIKTALNISFSLLNAGIAGLCPTPCVCDPAHLTLRALCMLGEHVTNQAASLVPGDSLTVNLTRLINTYEINKVGICRDNSIMRLLT